METTDQINMICDNFFKVPENKFSASEGVYIPGPNALLFRYKNPDNVFISDDVNVGFILYDGTTKGFDNYGSEAFPACKRVESRYLIISDDEKSDVFKDRIVHSFGNDRKYYYSCANDKPEYGLKIRFPSADKFAVTPETPESELFHGRKVWLAPIEYFLVEAGRETLVFVDWFVWYEKQVQLGAPVGRCGKSRAQQVRLINSFYGKGAQQ